MSGLSLVDNHYGYAPGFSNGCYWFGGYSSAAPAAGFWLVVYGESQSSCGPLFIIDQPDSQTVRASGLRSRSAFRPRATPELQYQWFKDGVEINGASDDTLVLSSVQSAHDGDYWVEVRDACDQVVQSDTAHPDRAPRTHHSVTPGESNGLYWATARAFTSSRAEWSRVSNGSRMGAPSPAKRAAV